MKFFRVFDKQDNKINRWLLCQEGAIPASSGQQLLTPDPLSYYGQLSLSDVPGLSLVALRFTALNSL